MKSPAGKEEVPGPMDATIMAYRGAQCKSFVQCNISNRHGQKVSKSSALIDLLHLCEVAIEGENQVE